MKIKKLEKDNVIIRDTIEDLLDRNMSETIKNETWDYINELVNNEIELEKYCNQ